MTIALLERRNLAGLKPGCIRGAFGANFLHALGERSVAGAREKFFSVGGALRVLFERRFEFRQRAPLQRIQFFVLMLFATAQRTGIVQVGECIDRGLIHFSGGAEAEEVLHETRPARLTFFE